MVTLLEEGPPKPNWRKYSLIKIIFCWPSCSCQTIDAWHECTQCLPNKCISMFVLRMNYLVLKSLFCLVFSLIKHIWLDYFYKQVSLPAAWLTYQLFSLPVWGTLPILAPCSILTFVCSIAVVPCPFSSFRSVLLMSLIFSVTFLSPFLNFSFSQT